MPTDSKTKANKSPSRIEKLKAEIARVNAEVEAAKLSVSDEDRAEIELRKELLSAKEEKKRVEYEQRELSLDARLEAARETWPKAKITSLLFDEYPDSFVIRYSPAAYKRWAAVVTKAASNKKIDRDTNNRSYAVACVIDWNGLDLSEPTAPGGELVEYLKQNPGLVVSIVNAVQGLAGAFTEARKS